MGCHTPVKYFINDCIFVFDFVLQVLGAHSELGYTSSRVRWPRTRQDQLSSSPSLQPLSLHSWQVGVHVCQRHVIPASSNTGHVIWTSLGVPGLIRQCQSSLIYLSRGLILKECLTVQQLSSFTLETNSQAYIAIEGMHCCSIERHTQDIVLKHNIWRPLRHIYNQILVVKFIP